MNKLSILTVCFSATVLGGILLFNTPVSADTTGTIENEIVKQEPSKKIANSLEKIANPYISFSSSDNQFILDDSIKNVVTNNEFNMIEEQVIATNEAIKTSLQNDDYVTVKDPQNNEFTINNVLLKGADKTDIEFHWNYARIYLSKSVLKTAVGVGAVIGGVYAPAKIIQAACGIVGLNVNKITSGIWFDYNYAVGALVENAGVQ